MWAIGFVRFPPLNVNHACPPYWLEAQDGFQGFIIAWQSFCPSWWSQTSVRNQVPWFQLIVVAWLSGGQFNIIEIHLIQHTQLRQIWRCHHPILREILCPREQLFHNLFCQRSWHFTHTQDFFDESMTGDSMMNIWQFVAFVLQVSLTVEITICLFV